MENYLSLLSESIKQNWNGQAISDFSCYIGEGGHNYTYGEMYTQMVRLDAYFESVGLQKGDHVAICGVNSANWVVAYFAVARFHGVAVTFIHRQTPENIEQFIDFSDAKLLFIDKEIWQGLHSDHIPQVKDILALDDFSSLRGHPLDSSLRNLGVEDVQVGEDNWEDVAQICFTSGTSATPKGVMMTYKNLSASVECAKEVLSVEEKKEAVSFFPLGHIIGLGAEVLVPMVLGCHIYYISEAIPFPKIMEGIMRIRPYQLLAVPMLIEKMMTEKVAPMLPVLGSFLDYFIIGGAALPLEACTGMIRAGLPLTIGYGMTETSLVSIVKPSVFKPGSVGKPIKLLKTRISPDGEILVRGENVMLGYYKNEEATRQKIDADGWLHTGDRGHLDEDGYLYVEGRLEQDMIVLPSGENIHPENIEGLLNKTEGVEESLVLARDGKLIALVRETNPVSSDQQLSERNKILAAVNPQLPPYAQLFGIEFLSDPLKRTEKQTIKRYLYK